MAPQDSQYSCIAVIILAAGKSARLGSPKQLLSYRDKTLLQHSIDTALESQASLILVVLGSEKDTIEKELNQSQIFILENSSWESGMASSISPTILFPLFPAFTSAMFVLLLGINFRSRLFVFLRCFKEVGLTNFFSLPKIENIAGAGNSKSVR